MNRDRPAFEYYANLDFIVWVILNTLGLNPERLRRDPENRYTTFDGIAYRNARRFVNAFACRPIHAIKEIRDHSGMDLVSSKEAWLTILSTYELEREYYRACIVDALHRDDAFALEHYFGKFKAAALN